MIFKASDCGYRNGCLRVEWNSAFVSTLSTLLLSTQPSRGPHQCPWLPFYSGLLSSHDDVEPTSPGSLPHSPLSALVSSDLSGHYRCFLVLSRGVITALVIREKKALPGFLLRFFSSHFLLFLYFIAFLFLLSWFTIYSFQSVYNTNL